MQFERWTSVKNQQLWIRHPVFKLVVVSTIILFLCSSLRHLLFQSTAFELGIYDQVAYLISIDQPPISSFLGIHHLGNHAALIMYPVALFYKIYPSVYWLFLIQSISLSLGAWPTWSLARQAGLSSKIAGAIALAYLLYPVIFNVNLFDFHPEVIALPAILGAILAARMNKIFWFCLAIVWILSCKDALALTVAAMGIWLYFFEKKRTCGLIAMLVGMTWFVIAVQGIIPYFKSGQGPGGTGRYPEFGDSVFEILTNIFLRPRLAFSKVFSLESLEYLVLLFSPVALWLSPYCLSPLVAALPVITKNLLSNVTAQRDLIHQYSVPVIPFLITIMIASIASNHQFYLGKYLHLHLQKVECHLSETLHRFIIISSIVGFVCLAKFGYFWSIYLEQIDTWSACRAAISLVTTQDGLLTTSNLASHLSQRQLIRFTNIDDPPQDLSRFKYVLLNIRHPGWKSTSKFSKNLVTQLEQSPNFHLTYQQDDVYLFTQKP
ncbi:MAG: DUF2079 domain-containing protein [Microcoleaceae cyanobacterium]